MSNLLNEIRQAQILAGERAVMEHLAAHEAGAGARRLASGQVEAMKLNGMVGLIGTANRQDQAQQMNPVWRALHDAPARVMPERCPTCSGNDGDMPCAYPSEGKAGCPRDARLQRELLREFEAVGFEVTAIETTYTSKRTDFKSWERSTLEQFARQVADEHLVLTERLAGRIESDKVDPKNTLAMCRALTDAEIVEVLHSHGIDTYPSKYGFPSLQVSATSVPSIRLVIDSCVARLNMRATAVIEQVAASIDTTEFRELMAWFATACHDPYAKLETKAVVQIQGALVSRIDQHCAAQVAQAMQARVKVPEGWHLVPASPVVAMEMGWAYIDAARAESPNQRWAFSHAGYRAMIAAAPLPPEAA